MCEAQAQIAEWAARTLWLCLWNERAGRADAADTLAARFPSAGVEAVVLAPV